MRAPGGARAALEFLNPCWEENKVTPFAMRQQTEGLTVMGEAKRIAKPEMAEMTLEIDASGPTAAQALRENGLKSVKVGQAVIQMGVSQSDVQSLGLYVQAVPSLPYAAPAAYPALAQLTGVGISGFPLTPAAMQPEIQPPATYYARNYLNISMRDPSRIGDVVDAAVKAGAIANGITFRNADEAAISREVLHQAAKEARAKAESLATALGKQLGEATSVVEDLAYSDGMGAAMRQQMPFVPMGQTRLPGELEFRARVLVTYRLQ